MNNRQTYKRILHVIIFIWVSLSLMLSGCSVSATPSHMVFARDVYPLIMGQIADSQIYFNANEGIVFYTPYLPSLRQTFAIYIPFVTQLEDGSLTAPMVMADTFRYKIDWAANGFKMINDTNKYVIIIRSIINANMTWKEFVTGLIRIQVAPTVEAAFYQLTSTGRSLSTMPLIIVLPINKDNELIIPEWWYLNDLYPEIN